MSSWPKLAHDIRSAYGLLSQSMLVREVNFTLHDDTGSGGSGCDLSRDLRSCITKVVRLVDIPDHLALRPQSEICCPCPSSTRLQRDSHCSGFGWVHIRKSQILLVAS